METVIETPAPSVPVLRRKAKVCLVGEPSVGKTSLIRRFVLNQFEGAYVSTLGVKVTKKRVEVPVTGRPAPMPVDLTIWDIMGARGFREALQDAYFYGARGILAVCDLTRADTCRELRAWLSAVFQVTRSVPVRILANKADLVDQRAVPDEDLRSLSEAYRAPYFVTSAKTGQNVEAGFQSLAAGIAEAEPGEP